MNGYPKGFFPLLMATTVLIFVSGLLLIPSFLSFRMQFDHAWVDWLMTLPITHGALRVTITSLHVFLGWAMIWFIGSLWTIHMRTHWRRNENRASGLSFMVFWIILILSGLAIFYVSHEDLSQFSSLLHVLLGLAMPIALYIHRRKGKKSLQPS